MTVQMLTEAAGSGEFLLYQTEDGRSQVEVRLEQDTVWLTQAQMAELFQSTKQNISLHIRNIFAEGELQPTATVKEYLTANRLHSSILRIWRKYPASIIEAKTVFMLLTITNCQTG